MTAENYADNLFAQEVKAKILALNPREYRAEDRETYLQSLGCGLLLWIILAVDSSFSTLTMLGFLLFAITGSTVLHVVFRRKQQRPFRLVADLQNDMISIGLLDNNGNPSKMQTFKIRDEQQALEYARQLQDVVYS